MFLSLSLAMVLSTASATFAASGITKGVEQPPGGGGAYLGYYDLDPFEKYYSQSCVANSSSMTFKIYNYDDNVNFNIQEKVSGSWKNKTSSDYLAGGVTGEASIYTTFGREYRVKVTAPIFSNATGSIYCY